MIDYIITFSVITIFIGLLLAVEIIKRHRVIKKHQNKNGEANV